MTTYRVTITGAQPTGKGKIELAVTFQSSEDGENWTAIAGSPATVRLTLESVRQALRTGSDVDKRAALVEEMRSAARALPALVELVTINELEALLVAGWPVTIGL